MAVTLIAVGETWKYTIPTDTENPTEWTLRILDARIRYPLSYPVFVEEAKQPTDQKTLEKQGWPPDYIDAVRELCRFGIAGWSRKDIPFTTEEATLRGHKYQVVSDDILSRLDEATVAILGGEILRGNWLSDDQKKRLASPGPVENGEATSLS